MISKPYIVIPCYNENPEVVRSTVKGLFDLGAGIVLVDDGSREALAPHLSDLPVTVLRHPINRGQGAALQTGMSYALRHGAATDGNEDSVGLGRLFLTVDLVVDAVGTDGGNLGAEKELHALLHIVLVEDLADLAVGGTGNVIQHFDDGDFCAHSGVGKSTHAGMWQQAFGEERCQIINGDKPIVRTIEGKLYGYGTPWCGKEGIRQNRAVELTDILMIRRGAENKATTLAPKDALRRLMDQIYVPDHSVLARLNTLDMAEHILKNVRFYDLECTPTPEAAQVAFQAIFQQTI